MNAFMKSLKRTSEYVLMILLFVASLFTLLFYVGNFDSDFMPVMGTLFSMILKIGLWISVPVLLAIRKRLIAKNALAAVSLYWFLTFLFSLLDNTALASKGFNDVAIAAGVFSFLIACALIVAAVFAFLAFKNNDKNKKLIALAIYCGALLLLLVLFSLSAAVYANWRFGWNNYFGLICDDLLIPFAMFFGAVAFAFDSDEFLLPERAVKRAKPVAADPDEEPAKEEAVAQPVEETPAETSSEDPKE